MWEHTVGQALNKLCAAQLGHQAVNCTNGTINWRQIYGDEAFRLKPAIFPSDVDRAKKEKEVDVEALERQAREYSRVSPCLQALSRLHRGRMRSAVYSTFGQDTCISRRAFPLKEHESAWKGQQACGCAWVSSLEVPSQLKVCMVKSCLPANLALSCPCINFLRRYADGVIQTGRQEDCFHLCHLSAV